MSTPLNTPGGDITRDSREQQRLRTENMRGLKEERARVDLDGAFDTLWVSRKDYVDILNILDAMNAWTQDRHVLDLINTIFKEN
jgi:hypothetical protein